MHVRVLLAINRLHTELLKLAKAADVIMGCLLATIEHVVGAIRTYDPAYRPRKPQLSGAKRTDMSRAALDALRQAETALTLRAMTLAAIGKVGLNVQHGEAVIARMDSLRSSHNRQKANGVVRSVPGPGDAVLWEVARKELSGGQFSNCLGKVICVITFLRRRACAPSV